MKIVCKKTARRRSRGLVLNNIRGNNKQNMPKKCKTPWILKSRWLETLEIHPVKVGAVSDTHRTHLGDLQAKVSAQPRGPYTFKVSSVTI